MLTSLSSYDRLPRMKNKPICFIACAAAATILVAAALIFLRHDRKVASPQISPQQAAEDIARQGRASLQKRIYGPLIEAYGKMLKDRPDDLMLKQHLAFAYFGAGDFDRARPLLEEVIRSGKASAEAFYELGAMASEEGRTEEARDNLKRALDLDPNHRAAREMMEEMSRKGQ